ncbi:MAG TPA: hypothetical protein VFG89_10975 [Coriobacteriia bacterium]|nr:hypothetical protein [Coriobacteriia bacterium]
MSEQKPKGEQRAARVALAVLAGALGTALVGGGLWMAFRPTPHSTPVTIDRNEPAERTEAPTMPVVPSTAATTTVTTSTPVASATTTSNATTTQPASSSGTLRAERVAFRLKSALYVSDESGGHRTKVAKSAEGPYALAPNGTTLAWVDSGQLKVALVGSKATTVGPADSAFVPVWVGDSSSLIYRVRVGDTTTLMRLPKGSKSANTLATGVDVASSSDSRTIVIRDSSDTVDDGVGRVLVSLNGGAFSTVEVSGGEATAVGVTSTRVFVGLAAADRGSAVVSIKPDGSDRREIAGAVPGDMPAVWGGIVPSPTGLTLALEAQGDDGYARTYTAPAGGGQLTALGNRLDVAFHGWSAGGSRIFLIEGNAIQGEATALVSVKPDGSAHKVVVSGAE